MESPSADEIRSLATLIERALAVADRFELHEVGIGLDKARLAVAALQTRETFLLN